MKFSSFEIDIPTHVGESARAAQVVTTYEKPAFLIVTTNNRLMVIDDDQRIRFQADLPSALSNDVPIDVHCFRDYVAIVERKGLQGVVLNLSENSWRMLLSRHDYHTEHCTWAIGFFEHEQKVHLIHATNWNRIDFTRLADQKCLTQRRIAGKEKLNYLDFFHSQLHQSPDRQHFVSNGWVWSPWDVLFVWSVENFLTSFEPAGVSLDALERSGYNWDRPCCFIDNETIAWAYNARESDSGAVPEGQSTELIFQNIHSKEIVRRLEFAHFDLTKEKEATGMLWFDQQTERFVCSSNRIKKVGQPDSTRGTTVADCRGKELWRSPATAEFYCSQTQALGFLTESKLEVVLLE